MSEIEKLKKYLDEHGYNNKWNSIFDGENNQIIVYSDKERQWDVVCHKYSYGGKDGLLEIYGNIGNLAYSDNSVDGWLTAEDLIKKYLEV